MKSTVLQKVVCCNKNEKKEINTEKRQTMITLVVGLFYRHTVKKVKYRSQHGSRENGKKLFAHGKLAK